MTTWSIENLPPGVNAAFLPEAKGKKSPPKTEAKPKAKGTSFVTPSLFPGCNFPALIKPKDKKLPAHHLEPIAKPMEKPGKSPKAPPPTAKEELGPQKHAVKKS